MKQGMISIMLILFISSAFAQEDKITFQIKGGLTDMQLKNQIEANTLVLLTQLNKAANEEATKVDLPGEGFSKEVRKAINEMWKSSAFVCSKTMLQENCLTSIEGYQVRNIPVTMLAADEGKNEQEIVLDYDKLGSIINLSVAIDSHRYAEIMEENQSLTDLTRRQIIVNFIEAFRTAYNRRDMKYLNQVYSDNALIITGHIVKEKPNTDSNLGGLGSEKIVYIKQNKQQYLSNLSKVFKVTKYLNVDFSDIEIIQHPKYDDIYGVTLKQDWHTSRYKDEGYLFLMIDFKDEMNPLIQVRTWQPYRFEGKVIPRDQVFSLGSFSIVR